MKKISQLGRSLNPLKVNRIYRFALGSSRQIVPRLFYGTAIIGIILGFYQFLPVTAAISQSQKATQACSASGSSTATCTATITSATANNLLIAVCTATMAGSSPPTVAMTGFTSAAGPTSTGGTGQQIFYKIASGGETSVSCTLTGSNNKRGMLTVFEYSGMATSSVVDGTVGTNTGTGLTATTGSTGTTTNADNLLIAGITNANNRSASSWTNSFTEQSDTTNNDGQATADLIVSSTGSYSTGVTLSGAGSPDWIGQVVAFKGAGAAPPATGLAFLTQQGYIWENDDGAAAGAGISTVFSDDFNRANSATVGNSWSENEVATSCETSISSNVLQFVSDNTCAEDPWITNTFTTQSSGQVEWIFDFNWTRTGSEGSYALYMQLGNSANMVDPSTNTSTGVAVNLKWAGTSDGMSNHEGFGYENSGGTTQVQVVSGATQIKVTADLDANTFDLDIGNNGSNEATGVAFHNNENIDMVRFFPQSVNQNNFSGMNFDNVVLQTNGVAGSDEQTQLAGTKFSSGKTLSGVRQGERINLRTQLTNSGAALTTDTELSLFYDRNDGIWSRVQNHVPVNTDSGSGCTNSEWICETLDGGAGNSTDTYNNIAIDKRGQPWVTYRNLTNNELTVARYVGANGVGCSGSSEWSCSVIDASGNYNSIAFSSDGTAYVAYYLNGNNDLKIAKYVESGGSGCTSSAWTCTTVAATGDVGSHTNMGVSPSGVPWIVTRDNTGNDLLVASFVTSGGNCDTTYGGSDAWECEKVETTNNVGQEGDISFDAEGNPWVSYRYNTGNALRVAKYVGGGAGSGCDDSDWTCTDVAVTGNHAYSTSINFDPSGNAWVAWREQSNGRLFVAKYVSSGGNCDGSYAGSDAWQCTEIDDADYSTGTNRGVSSAFDAAGNLWISYFQDPAGNGDLWLARYIGGGNGTGCAYSSDWTCVSIQTTDDVASFNAIAFSGSGVPWISYLNDTDLSQEIAHLPRGGDILLAPSTSLSLGDSLGTSHADMTSVSDTTNRDDADCIASSTTWNNGIYTNIENTIGLTINAGNVTQQCSEILWTIDTSQAIAGETYRFIVATKDALDSDHNNHWRGPTSVATDAYPTLTIASDETSTYRYSKDVLGVYGSNCSNTAWSCTTVDANNTVGEYVNIAYDPSGTAWISYYDGGTRDNLRVAKYVGSGGNCDDSGGSDAWQCTDVDVSDDVGSHNSLAIDSKGNPWISYRDVSNGYLNVARYVGSGGNCDTVGAGSDAWECTVVDSSANVGAYSSIATHNSGTVWISYYDQTSLNLKVAQYVGGNGSCSSSEWNCYAVDATGNVGANSSIAVDNNGVAWISYYDSGTNNDVKVARFVGGGGNCDSTGGSDAWQCTTVKSAGSVGVDTSIAVDANGTAWVSYRNNTNSDLEVAKFVGGGSGSGCASSDWTCTLVDATGDIGWRTSIALDSAGNPWISHRNSTGGALDLELARYVGSGGNCDDTGGSDAWECSSIDQTNDTGLFTSLAFDKSGAATVAYFDNTNANVMVAKLKAPATPPGDDVLTSASGRNAGSGDSRYLLSSGLSPYTDTYETCGGILDYLGYCGLFHADGQLDTVMALANERPIYSFSTRYDSNSTLPTAQVFFRTNIAPSTKNVVLQAYRYGTTNAWETVSTYSSAGCLTSNCEINGLPSGTTSEYFEADGSNYWVHFRLYQEESTGSSTTLKLDQFTAHKPQVQLRGGRVFRELISNPLGW